MDISKKAVIFHGTDGKPNELWQKWLRDELELAKYKVFAPLLPDNHTPSRKTYENFLKQSGWDFTDNLLVGHSSGATTILNLLMSDWFPNVATVILVGTFLNLKLVKNAPWFEVGQFDELFLGNYDDQVIKNKAKRFYFVHGDNDPYCNIDDARKLCKKLNGKFIVIKNGHHLASTSGLTKLPQLKEILQKDKVI